MDQRAGYGRRQADGLGHGMVPVATVAVADLTRRDRAADGSTAGPDGGLSPEDLLAIPRLRPVLPTFAEYVSVVSGAVTAGTRRACGPYWHPVLEHWGGRRLDEPMP
jgi:hypothetical protein